MKQDINQEIKDSGIKGGSGGDFTTMFIFPPQWTPQNPHFAITSLAGQLRASGHKVLLKDLNVEFYDMALSPEFLEYTFHKIRMNYSFLNTRSRLKSIIKDKSLDFQVETMRLLTMEKFFKENAALIENLPKLILDAKETLRDPRRFYNPLLLVDAFFVIDKALEFISLPYFPSIISFNNFDQPLCLLATAHLIEHASDKSENLFYDYFQKKIPEILEQKPNLIGISINSFSQVLPGLTLAKQLKEAAPEGTIINIGGNFFMRVKETLMKRPEFFENFCHSVSMGEGEKQAVIMVEEMKSGRRFSGIPDILYYEDGKVFDTFHMEPEKLENIAVQDLEGLPLDLYFTPNIVSCLQMSKGCYWGKCTFCDTDFGIKKDAKSLDKLVGEIKYLKEKYGIKNFEFIDESIRPSVMKKMADRFIKEDLGVNWFTNGRLEADFKKPLLKKLHKAGLTMVLWGFESGSKRILDIINKGIDPDGRFDILRASHEAGIWNFAYIFFGFPTETKEEATETINALVKNNDIIDSYGRSVFTLGKHSLLYTDAQKYGILDIIEDSEELSTNLHYRTSVGMNGKEIDGMMRECTKTCAEAYDYNLWYYLRNRENIHLYMVKYGKEYIRNYPMKQELSDRLQVW